MDLIQSKLRDVYLKYLAAALGSTLILTIYSSVDMIAVGQYAGPTGTAALTCVTPLWSIVIGLGVLLVFTVLGCVLEVFLARRESIWPGLALPILAGLYAVVMALSYTAEPDTPWNQVLGGVLAVFLVSGIPAFLLLMVFFICRSGRRRKKQLEKMNVQDL